MKTVRVPSLALLITLSAVAAQAHSAPSAQEINQLGGALTPWGAEKAGNAEGTIPAYTGTRKSAANYDPKNPGLRPDPYADESPLYTVTAQNMETYASVLTGGLKALLIKYPDYKIRVYPTHRTAIYPDYVQENSIKNASECKSINNGLQIEGCYGGVPFPIPKNGSEVMWNHIVGYTSPSYSGINKSTFVDRTGRSIPQTESQAWIEYPFYSPKPGVRAGTSPYWLVRSDDRAPARVAGQKLILIDHLDFLNVGRQAWQYIPGQRRVKLTPDLAYDTPSPQSGGGFVMDEGGLFIGAQDRYDFKLVGKKEMLIPYNNFNFIDSNVCPESKRFLKGVINPDCFRFELHRVWVLEGNLKPGQRHVYPKRLFYFDEDVPSAGLADNFDASGKLYRTGFTSWTPWYETADQGSSGTYGVYDLATGTYAVAGDTSGVAGYAPSPPRPARDYAPDSLTGAGIR